MTEIDFIWRHNALHNTFAKIYSRPVCPSHFVFLGLLGLQARCQMRTFYIFVSQVAL